MGKRILKIACLIVALLCCAYVIYINYSTKLPNEKIETFRKVKDEVSNDLDVPSLVIINTASNNHNKSDADSIENVSVLRFKKDTKTMHVVSVAMANLDGTKATDYVRSINKKTKLNAKFFITINYDDLKQMAEWIGRDMTVPISEGDVEFFNKNQDMYAEKYKEQSKIQYLKSGQQLLNPMQLIAYADIHYEGLSQTNDLHFRYALNIVLVNLKGQYLSKGPSLHDWDEIVANIKKGNNNLDDKAYYMYCAAFNQYKLDSAGFWLEGEKRVEYGK